MDDVQVDQQSANAAPPAVGDAPAQPAATSRASLVMRLMAKIDALETKIATGVHVFSHEVAELREHVKSVL